MQMTLPITFDLLQLWIAVDAGLEINKLIGSASDEPILIFTTNIHISL